MRRQIAVGIGLTLVGMLGASAANVMQARPEIRRYPVVRATCLVDGGGGDHRRRRSPSRMIGSARASIHARLLAGLLYLALPPRS